MADFIWRLVKAYDALDAWWELVGVGPASAEYMGWVWLNLDSLGY